MTRSFGTGGATQHIVLHASWVIENEVGYAEFAVAYRWLLTVSVRGTALNCTTDESPHGKGAMPLHEGTVVRSRVI
jgi:hypothetical protein